MLAFNKKTGLEITGTLETISGRADVWPDAWQRTDDGRLTYEYGGETEIFWDGQETVTNARGVVFLDSDGNECAAEDIDLRDDEAGE